VSAVHVAKADLDVMADGELKVRDYELPGVADRRSANAAACWALWADDDVACHRQ
jgi:hypothetical protein